MKTCRRCQTQKPFDQFAKRKAAKDGHHQWCRQCASDYHKEWYAKNRDQWKERVRMAAQAEPEKNRARVRQWALDHPERAKEMHKKSKAKRRERFAAAKVERVSWVKAWDAQGGICGECGKPINRKLKFPDLMRPSHDHIVPIAKGGLHEQSNVQWTHLYCNMLKGARV